MSLYQTLQNKPFLIAGPCVIESTELLEQVAVQLRSLQAQYPNWQIVFKA